MNALQGKTYRWNLHHSETIFSLILGDFQPAITAGLQKKINDINIMSHVSRVHVADFFHLLTKARGSDDHDRALACALSDPELKRT